VLCLFIPCGESREKRAQRADAEGEKAKQKVFTHFLAAATATTTATLTATASSSSAVYDRTNRDSYRWCVVTIVDLDR